MPLLQSQRHTYTHIHTSTLASTSSTTAARNGCSFGEDPPQGPPIHHSPTVSTGCFASQHSCTPAAMALAMSCAARDGAMRLLSGTSSRWMGPSAPYSVRGASGLPVATGPGQMMVTLMPLHRRTHAYTHTCCVFALCWHDSGGNSLLSDSVYCLCCLPTSDQHLFSGRHMSTKRPFNSDQQQERYTELSSLLYTAIGSVTQQPAMPVLLFLPGLLSDGSRSDAQ